MKTPTFSEVKGRYDLTATLLRDKVISPGEAIKIFEECGFYIEHWKILKARTEGYVGLGYLNN